MLLPFSDLYIFVVWLVHLYLLLLLWQLYFQTIGYVFLIYFFIVLSDTIRSVGDYRK